jgi:hypothetical protein
MITASSPQEEERAARKRQRDLDKMQKGAEVAREQEKRTKLAGIIGDELARNRGCQCGITWRTTWAEIQTLGEGCTHRYNGYICPTLDAIRRRMGR